MKNAVIVIETVLIALVAGVVAAAILLWRGGFVDIGGVAAGRAKESASTQPAPAMGGTLGEMLGAAGQPMSRAASTNSTPVGLLKLEDELYTKGQADGRFATLDVTDALAASIGRVPDDGYADGSGWSVELTQSSVPDTGGGGIPWTRYSVLVRKNDGTKVEPELEVTSREGGARYARSFFMEVMSPRDGGAAVASLDGNAVVPTFAAAGVADVKVSYDGSEKTVSLGMHPLYPFDGTDGDEVSALALDRRRQRLERARRAGVKVD